MMERDLLVRRLEVDLVGPLTSDEVLEDRPSDVYLTGILWPRRTVMGDEEADRLDSAGSTSGSEDDTEGAGEQVPMAGRQRPCTAGLSFAVAAAGSVSLNATLEFALYLPDEAATPTPTAEPNPPAPSTVAPVAPGSEDASLAPARRAVRWVRHGQTLRVDNLAIPQSGYDRTPFAAAGLPPGISLHMRSVHTSKVTLVTLTVINEMTPTDDSKVAVEERTMFQVSLRVTASTGSRLVSKPDAIRTGDEEEESAALLYRGAKAFAAGHTCSATWEADPDSDTASSVATSWLPRAAVPRVHAGGHAVFDGLRQDSDLRCLEAHWLGDASPADLRRALDRLVDAYGEWIIGERQRAACLPAHLQPAADRNLRQCEAVRDRMRRGVVRITEDANLRASFKLANRALQLQHEWNPERKGAGPLIWRPFQLGFVLLAAPSVCDERDPDRGMMDLLWFPTGGGKTEAYLALIAMLAFYRRLATDDPDAHAGVAAVMRYTLRLLTTQQFVRAAALILACDLIRQHPARSAGLSRRLGGRPFSIGLWLGGDATPNRFADAVMALNGARDVASPEQLTRCPCCHEKLHWSANQQKERIEVRCRNGSCPVGAGGKHPLPVWTVDDDVYRERPTLLIGTIDKFAQLPRRKEIHDLFAMGTVDSPDLIIQDELHLISGPLGTIAAMYEVAFDWLIARDGRRAKIVGSTATIRRAADQTRALFNRDATQFPPPGLDHSDSGFAVVDEEHPGRLYLAVTTAGRSAKFTLQAVAGSLLQGAEGAIPSLIDRDPYATLVVYFNSLRELGGSLVLMQDDVDDSLRLFAKRRDEPVRDAGNIEELTSRRTQEEVRDMLDKLAVRADEAGCIDVVLATSMVSVGVDVPRLGIMLVNGQPKMRSEYIQATSRVGRDRAPGLIVVLLNSAKPRDRSHYESFPVWHQSLYRDVEATSVTPFASRARDRAMHAALVAMVRHGVPAMLAQPGLSDDTVAASSAVLSEIVARAHAIDPGETRVRRELDRQLADWEARNPTSYWNDRQAGKSLLQSAERAAALRALGRAVGSAWPTMNNMRSVEPGVRFRLAEGLRKHADEIEGGGAEDDQPAS